MPRAVADISLLLVQHSFRVLAVRENKFMKGVWQSQTSATARQGVNQRQSWGLEYVFEASKRRVSASVQPGYLHLESGTLQIAVTNEPLLQQRE